MNKFEGLLGSIWQDVRELEDWKRKDEEIVVYMSRELLSSAVSWLRHLIYYHGADLSSTIFGLPIVPTYEPGLAYAVGIRRRMDFLREAGAEGAESGAAEATP